MKIITVVIVFLLLVSNAFAQECGPGCPICSGSGSNTESLLAKGVVLSSVLMIPEGEEDTFIPTFKTAIH
ncbi:MAG: hypothetical protein GY863_07365, partial [bacterium]|nr:hypothetical protein [bacterium]